MENIFIYVLGVMIIVAFFTVLYQRNKVKHFYTILNEVLLDNKVGRHTELYIERELLNIEYILTAKTPKLKAFPLLKHAYLDELKFLSEIKTKKEFSDKQKDKLITILQTKLTSNAFMKI